MSFSIEWKPMPAKSLKKLPEEIASRILRKLDDVARQPFRYLEHYEGDWYKLRVGDYRLLIDIDWDGKALIVEVCDKRGRIYK